MASYYVYSTLTSNMKYTVYKKDSPDLPIIEHVVLIHGGANLADKTNPLLTPKGFVTEITETDYQALQRNPIFQLHVKNGYVKIEPREIKLEKAISGLTPRDESSPKIPTDFSKEEKPLVGVEITKGEESVKSKKK